LNAWATARVNATGLIARTFCDDSAGLQVEQLVVLSCNIDDMNPQWYEPLMKHLSEAGALDVWLTPVQMKKNRPGTLVEVLCAAETAASLRDVLLVQTTTLGVRETVVTRYSLPREMQTVQTQYGEIRVKVARLPDGTLKASPEHDDCVARAEENGVSIREVWLEAFSKFNSPK
jgi:pyridinium-3,5-bisthiocarboxylic acid mononucleotide nickel chelatase